MASDESGDKTEQPSDHRRQEARRKGNVARSQDLNTAGHMLAAAFILMMLGIPTIRFLATLMRNSLRGPAWINVDGNFVMKMFSELAEHVASGILPIMLTMMGAALFFNFVQVGFLISSDAVMPKFNRLDPIQGAKRLLSIQAIVKPLSRLCEWPALLEQLLQLTAAYLYQSELSCNKETVHGDQDQSYKDLCDV